MDSDLRHLIVRHRKARRLSQFQLAQAAGVGKTVVFDIEHGKPTVQLDTVLKILGALNIEMMFNCPPAVPMKAARKRQARTAAAEAQGEMDGLPVELL